MATVASGGFGGSGTVDLDGRRVTMCVSCEVSGMAEGAVAGTIRGSAVPIGAIDEDTGHWGMAEGAGANAAVAVDIDDDIADMATGAQSDAADAAMAFYGMVSIVCRVWTMAV